MSARLVHVLSLAAAISPAVAVAGDDVPVVAAAQPEATAGSSAQPVGLSEASIAAVTEHLPHGALEDPVPGETDSTDEDLLPMDEGDAPEGDAGSEGAAGSNPLASVSVLDLTWQYKNTPERKHVNDIYAKGSTMLHPRLKLSLELHYWDTNASGSSENDWEQLSVKPIFFVKDMPLDDAWGMRIAAGLEYIHDFDNDDKGIGAGADQIAPLLGFAFMNRESKTVLIPLVQHFEDVESGADIRQTAFRVIALQPLDAGMWAKADVKVPRDWENETWPATGEFELGKMLTDDMGVFAQGLIGIGGERPMTYGAAIGLRINF
jgi:hypothetical protein